MLLPVPLRCTAHPEQDLAEPSEPPRLSQLLPRAAHVTLPATAQGQGQPLALALPCTLLQAAPRLLSIT